MISEYGNQIKAFFHFMFKHFFEVEFSFRVIVEILLFVICIYIFSNMLHKIISKFKIVTGFINRELVIPLRVRLFEKLAFMTNNPNWQDRANKIKDVFKESKKDCKKNNNKKSHAGLWIFIYIVLTSWIIGFHYYGEEKHSSYEVFFLGENVMLAIEEWITDTLFKTDESSVECFFHNKIEKHIK